MTIFLLTIKDPHHECWGGYGGQTLEKIVVRAATESAARDIALDALNWSNPMEGKGSNRRMVERPDPSPVHNREVTSCIEFETEGADEVIAVQPLD